MTIQQYECPNCGKSITRRILKSVLYTLATEGNTVEAIDVPVSCEHCQTVMILSAVPMLTIGDAKWKRVVPYDLGEEVVAPGEKKK